MKKTTVIPGRRKKYNLLFMTLPFMVIVLLFNYVPIFGWIYSVFDYIPGISILECDFVGLDYFRLIFRDANVVRTLKNTFIFALIGIVLTPLPMLFAILLNEIKCSPVRRVVQTFTTLPNFISWVIIFSLAFSLFATDGVVTSLIAGDYRKRSDFYIKLRRIGLLVSDAFGYLEVPGLEFHHLPGGHCGHRSGTI